MTKKKELTIEQYEKLTECVISQDKEHILTILAKKKVLGEIHEVTFLTLFDTITDSINFEMTATTSGEFYEKYLRVMNGCLETKEGMTIAKKEEIKKYFGKDEIIILISSLFMNAPNTKKLILFEKLLKELGQEQTEDLILNMQDKIKFALPNNSEKQLRLTKSGIKTTDGEIINNKDQIIKYFGEEDYAFCIENFLKKVQEKISECANPRDRTTIKKHVLNFYNQLLLDYLRKGETEKADYLMEKIIKENKKEKALKELDEKSSREIIKIAEESVDDMLETLNSYLNMKQIIGESEFLDNLINQVKETLKRYS